MICPNPGCECVHESDTCPRCEEANVEAGILAAAINGAAGVYWPANERWGGSGRTVHDYELHKDLTKAEFLLRYTFEVGTATDKQKAAEELIHTAVGLIHTGFPGHAQAIANRMVGKAASYFENINTDVTDGKLAKPA